MSLTLRPVTSPLYDFLLHINLLDETRIASMPMAFPKNGILVVLLWSSVGHDPLTLMHKCGVRIRMKG